MLKKYTTEEIEYALSEYKESGLSMSEYTRNKGIATTTFRGWLNKNKINELEGFGLINFETTNDAKINIAKVVVNFNTDKIKIELKEGYDKKMLKNIIKAVSKC